MAPRGSESKAETCLSWVCGTDSRSRSAPYSAAGRGVERNLPAIERARLQCAKRRQMRARWTSAEAKVRTSSPGLGTKTRRRLRAQWPAAAAGPFSDSPAERSLTSRVPIAP
jgi:hypothetical protein